MRTKNDVVTIGHEMRGMVSQLDDVLRTNPTFNTVVAEIISTGHALARWNNKVQQLAMQANWAATPDDVRRKFVDVALNSPAIR